MDNIIEFINLGKVYNQNKPNEVHALKNVSLKIKFGEMCAICGTSGAGKTTLLNIIGCLDSPTDGKYILQGEDVAKFGDRKLAALRNKCFGYVLQDYGLIENRTIYENVKVPLVFSNVKSKDFRAKIWHSLKTVGLESLEKRSVSELSGGQAQRVAIARALVNSPDTLLADEPTGALDTAIGSSIMDYFQKINEMGTTVIIVTHNEKIAARCQRIIHIENGEIVD